MGVVLFCIHLVYVAITLFNKLRRSLKCDCSLDMQERGLEEMKNAIFITLSISIASCLALFVINQSNYLSIKAHVASYLVKRHVSYDDVRGVLSNTTPVEHDNMFDDPLADSHADFGK